MTEADDVSMTRMRGRNLRIDAAARTLIVVHCYKENDSVVRIISARKATRKEVRFFEEGI
jgi:uncharacterized protein